MTGLLVFQNLLAIHKCDKVNVAYASHETRANNCQWRFCRESLCLTQFLTVLAFVSVFCGVFFLIVVKTWIAGCNIRLFHSALFLASAHTFVRNYLLSSLDNDTMILLSLQPSDNKEQVTNGWFILKLSLPFYKNGYRKYFLVYDIDLCEHYITFKLLRSEKI